MKKMLLLVFSLAFSASLFAQDTTFSFASDDNHDNPTFSSPDRRTIAGRGEYDLIVDVNSDLGGGQVTFQTQFSFEGLPYKYQVIPCGNAWLHIWKVTGTFSFRHFSLPGSPLLLEAVFDEAVLTSLSPAPDFITETMTLQDNNPSDPSLKYIVYPLLSGVIQGPLTSSADFAFTFTNLRGLSGPTIGVYSSGTFDDEWVSEGSFSGSAR